MTRLDDEIAKLSPHSRGALAAELHQDARSIRDKPRDSEFDRLIAHDLADALDRKADELGPSWCILCGAWGAVPQAHATERVPCGLCGAPTTQPPPTFVNLTGFASLSQPGPAAAE